MIRTPTLDALLANPDALPEAVVDCLQDCGATLADVLLLFAGEAPAYTGGLSQAVLVEWCRATEPKAMAPEVPYTRWQAIAGLKPNLLYLDNPRLAQQSGAVHTSSDDEAVSRERRYRDLKRRVLGLFPEVKIVRSWAVEADVFNYLTAGQRAVALDDWIQTNVAAGETTGYGNFTITAGLMRFDDGAVRRGWCVRQEIPAPDLIPPEPVYRQIVPQPDLPTTAGVLG